MLTLKIRRHIELVNMGKSFLTNVENNDKKGLRGLDLAPMSSFVHTQYFLVSFDKLIKSYHGAIIKDR